MQDASVRPLSVCLMLPQSTAAEAKHSSGGKGSEDTAAAALRQYSGSGDCCDSGSRNNKKQNQ